jgi:FlaG/FlaF family flagellin (archaellin)
MKRGVGKHGLSPVIASMLMILLVLVLASMIFLWSRGFIAEQIEKFGGPIEDVCGKVSFEVYRDGSKIEVVNRGNVDIRHLDIKMFKDGDSEISKFDLAIDAGKSVEEHMTLTIDGQTPDKIIAYPALIGNVKEASSNSVFTCLDSGVVI